MVWDEWLTCGAALLWRAAFLDVSSLKLAVPEGAAIFLAPAAESTAVFVAGVVGQVCTVKVHSGTC